jgi:ATP-dependent protease HslVU (ClpYQ) peptidase subunit
MSIIVAVQKNDSIVVAADTMHSTGSHREHADNLIERSKLRKIGRSYIGGVGWSVYDNILDHYLRALKRTPTLRNEAAIFDFFLKFWKALRDRYQVVNDQPDREDHSPFASLDSEFLIVNANGIFEVASDLTVMRFDKYVAIGSGDKYAYGVLFAQYNGKFTAEQMARTAAEAAVHFDQSCGGSIDLAHAK